VVMQTTYVKAMDTLLVIKHYLLIHNDSIRAMDAQPTMEQHLRDILTMLEIIMYVCHL